MKRRPWTRIFCRPFLRWPTIARSPARRPASPDPVGRQHAGEAARAAARHALFHRTKANVGLSPAGERLLDYARRILTLNEEAVGRLREHRVEGRVRLGVMDDYGTMLLPPLLSSFIANYPLIDVEMETGLTSTMTERLGKTYDLVIAMHPEGHSEGELLRREQAVWAASAEHRVEHQDPLPIALYPQGCLFRRWAIEALDRRTAPGGLPFVSHSLSAVEAIAAQGLAVTGSNRAPSRRASAPVGARRDAAFARRRHLPAPGPNCRALPRCWRIICAQRSHYLPDETSATRHIATLCGSPPTTGITLNVSLYGFSVWVLPLIIAITFHEAAHGLVAWRLGDDTA